MNTKRAPQTCRWAEPTLYLPLPYWLDAWDAPWSCIREGPPRLIESTRECATCRQWEARCGADVTWTLARVGR